MSQNLKKMGVFAGVLGLIAGSVCFAAGTDKPAHGIIGVDLAGAAEEGPAPPTDPPGLLEVDRLATISDLAARLSADRSWMKKRVLRALESRGLPLDEIFNDAPRFVTVDGVAYRVKLERVGTAWSGFDARIDPFLVYLTHEVFDGFGEDVALGYENGAERILYPSDLENVAAIAVTLAGLAYDELPTKSDRVAAIESPITLGKVREEVRAVPEMPASFAPPLATKACSQELAPTCSGTTVTCGAGYKPYFLLSSLKIKTDHEGAFKGSPEIDLFSLRLDSTSAAGGSTNTTTPWIFSGRWVTDVEGRSRYLPDVNNNNQWYNVTGGGLAVFPTNVGKDWSATLIEDDSEAGKLKMDNKTINVTKVYETVTQIREDIRQKQYFHALLNTISLLDILGVTSNDDDLYQRSIGVTSNLYCTNGVGQPFPKIFTFTSEEWDLQGYFACINPAC